MHPRPKTVIRRSFVQGWGRRLAAALLLLTCVNALAAGYGFMAAPDGSALGIPQDWLNDSPFEDYTVPGALLFSLGLLFGVAGWRQLARRQDAWFWGGLSGAAMIVWILAQAAMMGYDRHPIQTTLQATIMAFGVIIGLLSFAQFRAWHLQWGASPAEASRAMLGDERFPRPSFLATRGLTIDAPPENVFPWIVQMGFGRAGFYSYDLLDNKGRPSLDVLSAPLQTLRPGDWIPMAKKITEDTAFRVAKIEAPYRMLWHKPDSTWAWELRAMEGGRTRLVTRLRLVYDWKSPMVVVTLALMEIGDPFMMRKCLLGIKTRAEAAEGRLHAPSPGPSSGDVEAAA